MQQRYYDPVAGRFISMDPVTADSGALFNRYVYANNNPVTMADTDGRMPQAVMARLAYAGGRVVAREVTRAAVGALRQVESAAQGAVNHYNSALHAAYASAYVEQIAAEEQQCSELKPSSHAVSL